MAYTLHQLETFVRVTQCGSFSAAARKMRKAQSAISSTIANLEIELGLELFDRSAKLPCLTMAGRTFLEAAESMLRQSQALEELANTLSLGLESRIDLVVDGAVPLEILTQGLLTMAREYPQIKLNILRPASDNALDLITSGQAGLGLILTAANYPPGISFRRLGDVALANVAPPDHPLTKLPVVSFAQLHNHRQLVYGPHAQSLPTGEYLQSGKSWTLNSYWLILELLKQGLGWAICPKHMIMRQLVNRELIELNLEAYPVTEWLVGLDMVWASSQKSGVAAAWLKNFLIKAPKPGLLNTSRNKTGLQSPESGNAPP